MKMLVDEKKCIGCEACVTACPAKAIHMDDSLAVIDSALCDLDGICIPVCPVEAIYLSED
ncbi:MAG: 4Fe-4S binding protein [Desulfuromonadaceae bacterium]|nr:4Fe-4S binding protein [Desulfuromonadaceae bacterium]